MSRLHTLRIRVSDLALGVGVVMMLGSFAWWWSTRPDPELERQISAGEQSLEHKPGTRRALPRFARGYYSGASIEQRERGEGVAEFRPPQLTDPGDLGPAEALASFQQVIGELEQISNDERKLSKAERAELYNRATGSFTALSAWVDPANADEQAMMNDAYAQMAALMRELDIRPPKVDPDYNPVRR
jgi:hypothetical protein